MAGPQGLLDPAGYYAFGVFGAVLMAVSVIGSALAQHRLLARWPATRPPPFTIRGAFAEIREAFSERAFLIFAAGGLAAYIHQGLNFSITNYINLYVLQLSRGQLMFFPLVLLGAVVLMFVTIGPLHLRFGKAWSAAIGMMAGTVLGMMPYALLLTGVWPAPGSTASAVLFFGFAMVATALGIIALVSATSMIAEIVEAFEERTGRRAEGSFYSGNWLVQKCATGAGIFLSGQIIAFSQLSPDALPGSVAQEVLTRLVLAYGGLMLLLALIAAWWLARFPITRKDHEDRINRLAQRRAQAQRHGAAATPDRPAPAPDNAAAAQK
jgi:GPH family glycoside/pentoside/hexuronide:cation symporter